MPSPKPEPNETGHVRPGGERHFKVVLTNKNPAFTSLPSERALTFKEKDGEHNAHTKASHCKEEGKKQSTSGVIKLHIQMT